MPCNDTAEYFEEKYASDNTKICLDYCGWKAYGEPRRYYYIEK